MHRATRLAKAEWLLAHPDLWQTFPTEYKDSWDPGVRSRLHRLALMMVRDGLYSRKTAMVDVEASVFGLVQFARFVRRNKEAISAKEQTTQPA